ncbi:MAG: hypothetical protein US54_C0030G0010 [Candidatus Roizmanbacteria bacterium GW2011_GWA2_37_7]|uniref:Uncharacterized protein n=1 Tax=Candidatus Roizmanbacteria bacterium GW2011_GWA2_37_7 TaxID=1618481 RepID=A0A0G0H309_9BACT|nr:MAG: hypothetical protein US54_C0030G0010 [Candidatus Roizmanbacteria bacterium GW2011_GWA2_37_7]
MNSTKKTDAVDKIKRFQEEILAKKPTFGDMVHDVRMMNFKIRPVSGNIAELDYGNNDFIDALWSLGKLDEFFRSEFETIDTEEQDAFFRMINNLRVNFQNKLKQANIQADDFEDASMMQLFEIEIIKDNNLRIN